jgi:hypothetical protein
MKEKTMLTDLARMQKITSQDATVVILQMMIMQTEKLVGDQFAEESKIAPDNLQELRKAKNKQIEILKSNLKYAKDRNRR